MLWLKIIAQNSPKMAIFMFLLFCKIHANNMTSSIHSWNILWSIINMFTTFPCQIIGSKEVIKDHKVIIFKGVCLRRLLTSALECHVTMKFCTMCLSRKHWKNFKCKSFLVLQMLNICVVPPPRHPKTDRVDQNWIG